MYLVPRINVVQVAPRITLEQFSHCNTLVMFFTYNAYVKYVKLGNLDIAYIINRKSLHVRELNQCII